MSYTERNVNSGSAAAALGFAVAVDDIENVGNTTNSNNSSSADTSYDNDVKNSNNQDNDQDNDTSYDNDTLNLSVSDNDVSNSHNQDNDTYTKNITDNDTFTKIINDNDTFTKTVNLSDNDVSNSHNQDNDTAYDNDVSNSHNQDNDQDNDVSNSHNYTSTDIDTTVDVAISDAFKEITDSYNQDNDWLQLDNLDFDVMNVVGSGALSGGGNDAMFNMSQVSELHDADTLYRPTVSNDAGFDVVQEAIGGCATAGDDFGNRGTANASADGVAQLEAFTQNIVMGANIQYNNVEMSVVGGDSSVTDGGDIS